MPASRRTFLKTAALAPFAFTRYNTMLPKATPLLSFSTLGCPDWGFEKVVKFAAAQGYSGLEIRGIRRELDLTKCPEFSTPAAITATKNLLKSHGLKIVDLGSSAALHHSEASTRQQNLDEGKRFIDLAAQLGCPFVRVFPNNLPKTSDRNAVIDLVITGLATLGDHAKQSGVTVLMESHGDAVQTGELKHIMEATAATQTGLLWDVVNMWAVTKEPPAQVYGVLKKFIKHTHLKDLKFVDGKEQYVLFGTGEAPVSETIQTLRNGGYRGYYSFEWEKLWHPEIDEPEVALAHFPNQFKQLYKK